MARCGNCGKALSCGCQKRKASDGASVCSNCVSNYEAQKINKTVRPLGSATQKWRTSKTIK
jgi:hypothetical protein